MVQPIMALPCAGSNIVLGKNPAFRLRTGNSRTGKNQGNGNVEVFFAKESLKDAV